MSGRRLVAGRYRLEERIGSGAMGVVWRGTDERLGRPVAVKQVFLHGGLDAGEADEVRQRTLREGRIAARLQHPHAISVFDASIDGDEPWLVMEYLPSRSLAAVLIQQGPLDPRLVARIGRQVADALDAAHQAGIVHRDVKPGNVLIGADGTVKITDFGISRASGDLTLTRTGMLAGTPAYLAPEVARGDDSSFASDVFSLGATLYAAVEGVPPFGADDNALALLHAVAAGAVQPPLQAGPLTALLMRLLRADPAERPTAAEARSLLGRVAHGTGAPARSAAAPSGGSGGGGDRALGALASSGGTTAADEDADRADAARDGDPGRSGPSTRRGLPLPTEPAAGDDPHRPDDPRRDDQRPDDHPRSDPASGRRPARATAVAVLVLALLAGAVVGALLLGRPTDTASPATAAPSAAAPADVRAQIVEVVRDYYATAPANSGAGWARLGPGLQSSSGGFASYQAFWSTMSSSRAEDATALDDSTVRATIVFTPRDRAAVREVHDLGLVRAADGTWLIDSDRPQRTLS